MYLIVSGSGRVGCAVARALLADGKQVRMLARTPAKLEELRRLGAEVVRGDLRDPASLARACHGVENVLATAHAIDGKGDNGSRQVDDLGNHHLIDAAHAEGVKQFVFISVLGARADHPVDFFRYKYGAEDYLRRSAISHTVLRPAAFMQTWASMIGQPIIDQGKTTIFGRGNNPINFVAEQDVVRFALIGLDRPEAINQTIDIGGPENLTLNQVAQMYEQILGVSAKRTHIPLAVLRAASALLQPFNPVASRMMKLSVLMDTVDQTFDPSETLRRYPMRLTHLEDVVRSSVAAAGRMRPTGVGA